MLPPWIIAELERIRRERQSERDERPALEIEHRAPPRQAPREGSRCPIVVELC